MSQQCPSQQLLLLLAVTILNTNRQLRMQVATNSTSLFHLSSSSSSSSSSPPSLLSSSGTKVKVAGTASAANTNDASTSGALAAAATTAKSRSSLTALTTLLRPEILLSNDQRSKIQLLSLGSSPGVENEGAEFTRPIEAYINGLITAIAKEREAATTSLLPPLLPVEIDSFTILPAESAPNKLCTNEEWLDRLYESWRVRRGARSVRASRYFYTPCVTTVRQVLRMNCNGGEVNYGEALTDSMIKERKRRLKEAAKRVEELERQIGDFDVSGDGHLLPVERILESLVGWIRSECAPEGSEGTSGYNAEGGSGVDSNNGGLRLGDFKKQGIDIDRICRVLERMPSVIGPMRKDLRRALALTKLELEDYEMPIKYKLCAIVTQEGRRKPRPSSTVVAATVTAPPPPPPASAGAPPNESSNGNNSDDYRFGLPLKAYCRNLATASAVNGSSGSKEGRKAQEWVVCNTREVKVVEYSELLKKSASTVGLLWTRSDLIDGPDSSSRPTTASHCNSSSFGADRRGGNSGSGGGGKPSTGSSRNKRKSPASDARSGCKVDTNKQLIETIQAALGDEASEFIGHNGEVEELIYCKECSGDEEGEDNQIFVCDSCDQGIHQLCQDPPIPSTDINVDPWYCADCDPQGATERHFQALSS
ncbi:hypothetical protein EV182_000916 [Spiromyces aspiralis]|uniref:Uncharacterized protein n=1 Tax=Spiromyces aspiralis TaxID=68401 RepID=A0ACC1HU92_9FUNG|nr:hypothetical protein EV182_000916 [Spiromyces aspiralis]